MVIRTGWLLLAVLLPSSAVAADWKITPRVSLSETYSDNVALEPSDRAGGDFVTQFNPGVVIVGEGRRLKVHADYTMQNILYADRSGSNKTYNQFGGNAVAEVVDEWFFVEGRARVAQQATSTSAATIAPDNVNISNNISTVRTLVVSPYVKHRFGDTATSELRYSREELSTSASTQSDSSTDRLKFSLASGSSFQRLNWRGGYEVSSTSNSGRSSSAVGSGSTGEDQTRWRTFVDGGYKLDSRFSVVGSVGYDDDDAQSTSSKSSGTRWTTGLRWTPSTRMSLDVRYQSSYRGDTVIYSLTERTRHTTWNSSYSEEVTTGQAEAINPQTFILIDPATQLPLLDENGRPVEQTVGVPVLTDDTFTNKRFQHSVIWTGSKSMVVVNLFSSRRESLQSGTQDKQYGATASWSLRLSQRTSSLASANWQRLKQPGITQERELWSLRVGLTHQLSPDFSGSVQLSHNEQSGGTGTGPGTVTDYTENRIFAGVTKTF